MQKTEIEKAAEEYYRITWLDDNKSIPHEPVIESFLAGAEYAAPKWVSVEKQLPEIGQIVLVYRKNFHHILVDQYTSFNHLGNDFRYDKVTHWQPLPTQPPKV